MCQQQQRPAAHHPTPSSPVQVATLVEHAFAHLLPVPKLEGGTAWDSDDDAPAVLMQVVAQLAELARFYAAAVMSTLGTRGSDTQRLLTAAAMAVVAHYLLAKRVPADASPLSHVLRGSLWALHTSPEGAKDQGLLAALEVSPVLLAGGWLHVRHELLAYCAQAASEGPEAFRLEASREASVELQQGEPTSAPLRARLASHALRALPQGALRLRPMPLASHASSPPPPFPRQLR